MNSYKMFLKKLYDKSSGCYDFIDVEDILKELIKDENKFISFLDELKSNHLIDYDSKVVAGNLKPNSAIRDFYRDKIEILLKQDGYKFSYNAKLTFTGCEYVENMKSK